MTRIVHVTTVHHVYDVRIFHKEAVTLSKAGYEVVLIAQSKITEVRQHIRIRPLPEPKNRLLRMSVTAWQAYRAVLDENPRICHFHDPELILVGLLLKLRGMTVIYDVHEDVAKDIVDKPYVPKWARPFIQLVAYAFEWMAALSFDRIIVATEAIGRKFPKRKVTVLRNLPILDELSTPIENSFERRPANVVYVGGLAPFNGIEQMVRAMGLLPKGSDTRLILAGKFASNEQEAFIRNLDGWKFVNYYGWVARNQISDLFRQARAALVVYQRTPNILESEPNKFFEVLSAGLPIIASNLPHWSRFVEVHRCGLTVDPSNPEHIAAAVIKLVTNPQVAEVMGKNGRASIDREYNWGIESRRLLDVYSVIESSANLRII